MSEPHEFDLTREQTENHLQSIDRLIVKNYFCKSNAEHTILGMEYCSGGDLYSLIRKNQSLEKEELQFFAANIILGLNRLHELGVIYRE